MESNEAFIVNIFTYAKYHIYVSCKDRYRKKACPKFQHSLAKDNATTQPNQASSFRRLWYRLTRLSQRRKKKKDGAFWGSLIKTKQNKTKQNALKMKFERNCHLRERVV